MNLVYISSRFSIVCFSGGVPRSDKNQRECKSAKTINENNSSLIRDMENTRRSMVKSSDCILYYRDRIRHIKVWFIMSQHYT